MRNLDFACIKCCTGATHHTSSQGKAPRIFACWCPCDSVTVYPVITAGADADAAVEAATVVVATAVAVSDSVVNIVGIHLTDM